ncbi:MAG: hypothetical protein Q7U85_06440 [Rhodocyclaceae bacterium]|nr:hypothetical protein [Rhodocyclaceae bacterium]
MPQSLAAKHLGKAKKPVIANMHWHIGRFIGEMAGNKPVCTAIVIVAIKQGLF